MARSTISASPPRPERANGSMIREGSSRHAGLKSWRDLKELTKFWVVLFFYHVLRVRPPVLTNYTRKYMEDVILPTISLPGTRVLSVGCRAYTYHYRYWFLRSGTEYWTCDIDPSSSIWGEGEKHIVADVRFIDKTCPEDCFDIVLMNGVFGFGVDDWHTMDEAITAISRVIKPGGHLLIGWNRNRVRDPQQLSGIQSCGLSL